MVAEVACGFLSLRTSRKRQYQAFAESVWLDMRGTGWP
jgi:hypothetical protein